MVRAFSSVPASCSRGRPRPAPQAVAARRQPSSGGRVAGSGLYRGLYNSRRRDGCAGIPADSPVLCWDRQKASAYLKVDGAGRRCRPQLCEPMASRDSSWALSARRASRSASQSPWSMASVCFDFRRSLHGVVARKSSFQTSAFRFGPVLRPPCKRHLPEGKSPAFLHCPPLRVFAPQGRNSRSMGQIGNFGGGR